MRSTTRRRYRGSKTCSGRTTPGNSGVPSGNNGMSSPVPPCSRGGAHGQPGRAGDLGRRPGCSPARPGGASCSPASTCAGPPCPGPRARGLLPRAATDIDSVLATVRPICEDVRIRGAQAVREITARLDGVDAATSPCRRRRSTTRWPSATPRSAPRWRRRSAGSARCTPTSGAPTSPPRSCPAARSPSAGCRSAGSASTCPAAWRRTRPAS